MSDFPANALSCGEANHFPAVLNEVKILRLVPMLVSVLEPFTGHHAMNVGFTNKSILMMTVTGDR